MEDKKCSQCKWYMSYHNSNERYNEDVYNEETTKVCDDYKEKKLIP